LRGHSGIDARWAAPPDFSQPSTPALPMTPRHPPRALRSLTTPTRPRKRSVFRAELRRAHPIHLARAASLASANHPRQPAASRDAAGCHTTVTIFTILRVPRSWRLCHYHTNLLLPTTELSESKPGDGRVHHRRWPWPEGEARLRVPRLAAKKREIQSIA
jgi:hypothetical protein